MIGTGKVRSAADEQDPEVRTVGLVVRQARYDLGIYVSDRAQEAW